MSYIKMINELGSVILTKPIITKTGKKGLYCETNESHAFIIYLDDHNRKIGFELLG